MSIKILRYRSYDKPPLVGYCEIVIEAWNLEIRGITIRRNRDDSLWFSFPGYTYEDERKEKKFVPYLNFTNADWKKNFQHNMKEAFNDYIKKNSARQDN